MRPAKPKKGQIPGISGRNLPEGEAQWQTLFPEAPATGFNTSLN
jgi:hypothetical protein